MKKKWLKLDLNKSQNKAQQKQIRKKFKMEILWVFTSSLLLIFKTFSLSKHHFKCLITFLTILFIQISRQTFSRDSIKAKANTKNEC